VVLPPPVDEPGLRGVHQLEELRAGEFNKWLKMVFILLSVFGGSFSLYVSSPSSCTFAGF
jgi:hypothetical protein